MFQQIKIISYQIVSRFNPGNGPKNYLHLTLKAVTGGSIVITKDFSVFAYVTPMNYQPVLNIVPNIVIPELLRTASVKRIDYAFHCTLTLSGSVKVFDFDLMLVFDEG